LFAAAAEKYQYGALDDEMFSLVSSDAYVENA